MFIFHTRPFPVQTILLSCRLIAVGAEAYCGVPCPDATQRVCQDKCTVRHLKPIARKPDCRMRQLSVLAPGMYPVLLLLCFACRFSIILSSIFSTLSLRISLQPSPPTASRLQSSDDAGGGVHHRTSNKHTSLWSSLDAPFSHTWVRVYHHPQDLHIFIYIFDFTDD